MQDGIPQWWGETIGFWNGDTLIAWTANVQGWKLSHSMPEWSNEFEVVEVFRPNSDGSGLIVEATFYDSLAFAQPLHTVTPWNKRFGLDDPGQPVYVQTVPNPEHDRQRSRRTTDPATSHR